MLTVETKKPKPKVAKKITNTNSKDTILCFKGLGLFDARKNDFSDDRLVTYFVSDFVGRRR